MNDNLSELLQEIKTIHVTKQEQFLGESLMFWGYMKTDGSRR